MSCEIMPHWWSWQAVSSIGTFTAVAVALFGEKVRRLIFRPDIKLREFPVPVADQREGLSKPVRFHHYVEAINEGEPLEDAQFLLLGVTFYPGKQNKERFVRVPTVNYLFGNHFGQEEKTVNVVNRALIRIGEVTVSEREPKLSVEVGHHYNPVSDTDIYSDPHARGRFHFQVVGKGYRSAIWPIDFVRDTQITSYWRLEVQKPEDEKKFWKRARSYIREHNEQKRKESLP